MAQPVADALSRVKNRLSASRIRSSREPMQREAPRSHAMPKPSSSINWQLRLPPMMHAHLRVSEMFTWTRASLQAVDAYQKALKVKPDYNGAYLPLAFSLARMNRYPEAIDIYKETFKRDPESGGL